jgi:hypothetical protein
MHETMNAWFWTYAPAWLQRKREAAIKRYVREHVIAPMAEAQAQGVGIVRAWAEPGTRAEDILEWFDDQLASVPRGVPLDCEFNRFRFFVVRCTPAEWQTVQAGTTVTAPRDRLLLTWEGQRSDWWRDGRDTVARICAADHPGLYLVANRLGAAFYAALTGAYS